MEKKLKNMHLGIIISVIIIVLILYIFNFFIGLHNKSEESFKQSLGKNGRINREIWTWGHRVIENEYGFREKNFSIRKPDQTYQIMILGDSLTWGAGLSYEQRYSYLLQERLNNISTDKKIEVLNFGISGGPTIKEYDILNKYKDIVDPDLIVVAFCLNDPQPNGERDSVERELFWKKNEDRITKVENTLSNIGLGHISDYLSLHWENIFVNFGFYPQWNMALDRVYDPESKEWRDFLKALGDIKKISDDLGLQDSVFIVLNQGYDYRAQGYKDIDNELLQQYLSWYHQAESAAIDTGFITTNIEEELKSYSLNSSMCVNKFDCHPSTEMNRLYADALFSVIGPLLADN